MSREQGAYHGRAGGEYTGPGGGRVIGAAEGAEYTRDLLASAHQTDHADVLRAVPRAPYRGPAAFSTAAPPWPPGGAPEKQTGMCRTPIGLCRLSSVKSISRLPPIFLNLVFLLHFPQLFLHNFFTFTALIKKEYI